MLLFLFDFQLIDNIADKSERTTAGLAKNWLTQYSINFCLAIVLQLSAGHYKFGDINNNELLFINLTAVRAGRISNASSSPSLDVSSHIL